MDVERELLWWSIGPSSDSSTHSPTAEVKVLASDSTTSLPLPPSYHDSNLVVSLFTSSLYTLAYGVKFEPRTVRIRSLPHLHRKSVLLPYDSVKHEQGKSKLWRWYLAAPKPSRVRGSRRFFLSLHVYVNYANGESYDTCICWRSKYNTSDKR